MYHNKLRNSKVAIREERYFSMCRLIPWKGPYWKSPPTSVLTVHDVNNQLTCPRYIPLIAGGFKDRVVKSESCPISLIHWINKLMKPSFPISRWTSNAVREKRIDVGFVFLSPKRRFSVCKQDYRVNNKGNRARIRSSTIINVTRSSIKMAALTIVPHLRLDLGLLTRILAWSATIIWTSTILCHSNRRISINTGIFFIFNLCVMEHWRITLQTPSASHQARWILSYHYRIWTL